MNTITLALALACSDMTAFQMPGMSLKITKAEKITDNLPPALARGFTVVTTDTGHKATTGGRHMRNIPDRVIRKVRATLSAGIRGA